MAFGSLEGMLRGIDRTGEAVLIFHDQSGRQLDFDLRGTIDEVLQRALPTPVRTGPGRPKLGVVSREVSLLPRHWEWLETQPNGASASLRRLVDEARKRDSGPEEARLAMEATGRVMTAIAGNLPGYEEATRALYARDRERFSLHVKDWPDDVRVYITELAVPAMVIKPA